MKNLLTLISSPANPVLTDSIVAGYTARLADVTALSWLADGIAVDIFFDGDITSARQQLHSDLIAEDFDFFFQPARSRVKKLLVADMDSTIIQCECIDELADFAGLKQKISAMTAAAMQGHVDF
ncbi:MAG: phosphoserine phosphatase SerB, partial [Alphaproteobacteria bacterium]|nr:phosphoserine phosphatase SerB [Alphaproteobacteria bacterium]